MGDFLQYFYVFLWGALAVLMFFTGFKQGAFAFVMSLLFVFMTVWYALRAYAGLPMFEGIYGVIFRCVLGGFLALFVIVYIVKKRNNQK